MNSYQLADLMAILVEKIFKSFLKDYFKTRISTPKTKVEAINPTLINPAMIAVLR